MNKKEIIKLAEKGDYDNFFKELINNKKIKPYASNTWNCWWNDWYYIWKKIFLDKNANIKEEYISKLIPLIPAKFYKGYKKYKEYFDRIWISFKYWIFISFDEIEKNPDFFKDIELFENLKDLKKDIKNNKDKYPKVTWIAQYVFVNWEYGWIWSYRTF